LDSSEQSEILPRDRNFTANNRVGVCRMPVVASNAWQRTSVHCLAGFRANERPISFLANNKEIEIRSILDSWRDPDYLYFKVDTVEDHVYHLRHHEYQDFWEMAERMIAKFDE
jgi:hypothetical protein